MDELIMWVFLIIATVSVVSGVIVCIREHIDGEGFTDSLVTGFFTFIVGFTGLSFVGGVTLGWLYVAGVR